MARYIGIDVGAETIKLVELIGDRGALRWARRATADVHKSPGPALRALLQGWDWPSVDGAAVTGRLSRQVSLLRVPTKQAQAAGYRILHGSAPATIVSIGSHGFSVLELRDGGIETFRENSRCAQGTGNFLRQLVERFDLTVEAAAALAATVTDGAPLSGRCPVILKTDMTHLANKGERKDRILAGLLDAIAENVQVLVKPRLCPDRLVLAGGVCRSTRVREHFRRFAERHDMQVVEAGADDGLFLDALGAGVTAAEHGLRIPPLAELIAPPVQTPLEKVPSLTEALARVRRLPLTPPREWEGPRDVVLGFDIGSTGSKAVALDLEWKEPLWESYLRTNGDPVGAAQALMQAFLDSPASEHRVRGFGATGSGREIVGSLLSTCYGRNAVHVLNEIAAHATGALRDEPRVDTIFEIGGQDAKYIRLAEGRVIDAAMNEACSAGTGSFIEEQGRRFEGIDDVATLGQVALDADDGVALGQHCSVFMAGVIDEAVAVGVKQPQIIAGIYDSVVANYLNRVKGSRSVGQVVFCQGMPFASDALAAAVARQTGAEVIVPAKPGLMGAIGIALMAADELPTSGAPALDARIFLGARVDKKDQFVCSATQGCGGAGNKCRIDRLSTRVGGTASRFTWGGNCSLWDKGTRKKKLPDLAPDPFRERSQLVQAIIDEVTVRRDRPVVALTDEFQLKGLFPFFATFLHRLGLDLHVATGADRGALKRGIEEANVPFCAPMQQYHGLVAQLAEQKPAFLFLPMLRQIPRVGEEPWSTVCPIVQGAPDMLKRDLGQTGKVVSPIVDAGDGLGSATFLAMCERLAAELGVRDGRWHEAWTQGVVAQDRFDAELLALGRRALDFCAKEGVTPVAVLGRAYTIHNDVLNSNVPSILREQGSIAIPVDCLPVPDEAPVFNDVFWGYSQRILRAAWAVRRMSGVYSVFCSNYSCGPDSFTVHTYAWVMEGKPFSVIETDGHAGDAGTRTRVEAFLHCVREDQKGLRQLPPPDPSRLHVAPQLLKAIVARGERVLIPRMGPEAEAAAAAMRGLGVPAETMRLPDADVLRRGRRHTSGKECLPMTVTLGSVLERVQGDTTGEKFVLLMPGSCGPCRFGAYRNLDQMIFQRLGLEDRLRIWSPHLSNYFEGMPPGFSAIVFTGITGLGVLSEAVHDVRPVETRSGEADRIHDKWAKALTDRLEAAVAEDTSAAKALWEATTGNLYGVPKLIRQCAEELRAIRAQREVPNVLVVGEIYVRSDPFSNGFIAQALESRGMRVRTEPSSEFVDYANHLAWMHGEKSGLGDRLERWVRARIMHTCHRAAAEVFGWPNPPSVSEALDAASTYMRPELEVETVLTLGVPLHHWRRREIDATVSVGPLECMPNKIAEAQFCHAAEEERLVSLTLSLNGDAIDPEVLDNFAFEVHQRFKRRVMAPTAAEPMPVENETLVPES